MPAFFTAMAMALHARQMLLMRSVKSPEAAGCFSCSVMMKRCRVIGSLSRPAAFAMAEVADAASARGAPTSVVAAAMRENASRFRVPRDR
jgi:hypothetical protein